MKKFRIQRKIEVWIEDVYRAEEINDEIIQQAIDYDLDPDNSETLWETQVDLGPIKILDENRKVIKEDYNE